MSCTVPVCTATFLPQALSGSNAVSLAAHAVPALKYVTKSTVASRSLESVNDDMPSSYLLPIDGMMLSNFDSWNSAVSPSFLAIAVPRSTSKPMILPLASLNSFGSYVGSVPMASLPSDLTASGTCAASASSFCTALGSAAPVADADGWPPPSVVLVVGAAGGGQRRGQHHHDVQRRRTFTWGLLGERMRQTLGHRYDETTRR